MRSSEVNLFEVSLEVARRAAELGIELHPHPREDGYVPTVLSSTPRGHYLWLKKRRAQIIEVDDFRPALPWIYDDLLPGFRLVESGELPGAPEGRSFVSLLYELDESLSPNWKFSHPV